LGLKNKPEMKMREWKTHRKLNWRGKQSEDVDEAETWMKANKNAFSCSVIGFKIVLSS